MMTLIQPQIINGAEKVSVPFRGLILDFVGVLTSSVGESVALFEAREGVPRGRFWEAVQTPEGYALIARVEVGEITQRQWNREFSQLLGVREEGLLRRLLAGLKPAQQMLGIARQARSAGIRTAVLSNSFARDLYDPYVSYDLADVFDVVVLSDEHGMRKPDPCIYELALSELAVPADACVFVDDTPVNLPPARRLGMRTLRSVDERSTSSALRSILSLPWEDLRGR
ncbi:HAD-IA family hydrolase [Streptomyces sp. NPDC126514]|uniref:HAD-IA family hydrolase n=1 Tax=Streptomyces sp. NPDC126514 TaxID=3155210 RepID=UPI00331796D2